MTEILNETLAQHLVAEFLEPVPGETMDGAKAAFARLMAVNPSIELYLLDKDGKILTFAVPPTEVRRDHVDLRPINDFVAHQFALPILGDDPRDPDRMKIFSAAMLDPKRRELGYLYVILGGAAYDEASQRLQGGLLVRSAITVAGVGITVALAAAFFASVSITRRLRLLAEAVDKFRHHRFQGPAPVAGGAAAEDGDELDRLTHAYNAMIAHIQTQMEVIAESNAVRRDLIAGVSHDLRTPLASLRGYLETLIMKDATLAAEDRRTYLEIASAQTDRMSRLVEELFELAMLDEIEARIDMEAFQLSELVQDVVQKFSLVAEEQDIELTGRYSPEAPLVWGNIPLLERLLDNLLENAIRHTGPGGRIDVSVTVDGANARLEVSDSGSGIPEQDLPHIFERFYRVDKSRSSSSGGAGLGLAIAKRIVELHGGRISVSSKMAVGTRFLVELPPTPGRHAATTAEPYLAQ